MSDESTPHEEIGTGTDDDEPDIMLSAEMVDREERKALKKKKKEQAQKGTEESRADDEIEAALAETKLAKAEKAKRKKIFKMGIGVVGIGLVGWLGYYLFKPFEAGLTYGICKTFLELNVQFPDELRIGSTRNFGSSVRIWYTQVDAFGEYRMENIQCYFKKDEKRGTILEKITVDRREVDPERVEAFNKILNVVVASPLDLVIPPRIPNSLKDLQLNSDQFRFQVNIRGLN